MTSVDSSDARAKPAATNRAISVRWAEVPRVAASVAERMATPRAAPDCLVAVSRALAVPSDRAATGPLVPASVPATWTSRLTTPIKNTAANTPMSDPAPMASPAPASAATPSAMANASTRLGPSAGTSFDAGPDNANAPSAWGTKHRPVTSALRPRPSWRYSVSTRASPPMIAPIPRSERLAPSTRRSSNRARSTSGDAARRSCTMKPPRSTAAIRIRTAGSATLQRVPCPRHSQHEHSHARRDRHGARDVRLVPARRLVGGKETPRTEEQRHPDRDVDEEHQAPRRLDQSPAEHGPGSEAGRHDRPVYAQGTGPALLVRPRGDEQRQAGGRQQRRPDALHDPRGDQEAGIRGHAAGYARRHEHHQARSGRASPARQHRRGGRRAAETPRTRRRTRSPATATWTSRCGTPAGSTAAPRSRW